MALEFESGNLSTSCGLKASQKIEFGKIQKFSRLAEQAGESNNKYTVNYIFV